MLNVVFALHGLIEFVHNIYKQYIISTFTNILIKYRIGAADFAFKRPAWKAHSSSSSADPASASKKRKRQTPDPSEPGNRYLFFVFTSSYVWG